jgi:hypothetical protein
MPFERESLIADVRRHHRRLDELMRAITEQQRRLAVLTEALLACRAETRELVFQMRILLLQARYIREQQRGEPWDVAQLDRVIADDEVVEAQLRRLAGC